MRKCIALLIPIVIKKSVSTANGNTKNMMIITEVGGKQCLPLRKDRKDEGAR